MSTCPFKTGMLWYLKHTGKLLPLTRKCQKISRVLSLFCMHRNLSFLHFSWDACKIIFHQSVQTFSRIKNKRSQKRYYMDMALKLQQTVENPRIATCALVIQIILTQQEITQFKYMWHVSTFCAIETHSTTVPALHGSENVSVTAKSGFIISYGGAFLKWKLAWISHETHKSLEKAVCIGIRQPKVYSLICVWVGSGYSNNKVGSRLVTTKCWYCMG